MSLNITIRRADKNDVKKLHALEQVIFSYDRLGPRSFRHLVQSASARVYIAESSAVSAIKALSGYAIVLTRRNSKYWRLYSMAINPETQGQGLGKKLLKHLLNEAKPITKGIRLEVKCDNQAGLALYRQFGFEVTDLLPHYYSDEIDETDRTDGYRMQYSWN